MTTLTIDLPEPLVSTLETHNVSKDTLNLIVQELLENWISIQFPHCSISETGEKLEKDTAESQAEFEVIQPASTTNLVSERVIYARQTDAQEKLRLMAQAAVDQQFLGDLGEVMTDFSYADTEWWEPE